MARQDVSLHDKYDLSKTQILLNGTASIGPVDVNAART